ncbi:MAG: bifunctional phosphoribosylaminoimidazolecarboxamide formyltransferase/IMP cyclohydrolase [Candidatus Omnitrophota bacterium]|nr:bifunctional phosphoribosylaminoimidazolecarboxamide formyltransferase/IMP cyclohydrolase [Candidatus Omnitrophota bacterium]
MIKVKRALISVSDKQGILEFARGLKNLGVEIISTGGTAKLLSEGGVGVIEVSDYTGFPEMLDGRVKTLHPKIHGGLLALRDNPGHIKQLQQYKIGLIDMVVVNLYPFEKTIQKKNVTLSTAIENIDIGGPSMLRSAAKNYRSVAVVSNPARYDEVLRELKNNNAVLSDAVLTRLALDVFNLTSSYDRAIFNYLKGSFSLGPLEKMNFPQEIDFSFEKIQDLRYGENSHQKAAFYRVKGKELEGIASVKQLGGKELSFNNILDLNSAWELVSEFEKPAAVIVKHNNPCGVSEDKSLLKAYQNAYKCDPFSAFGGIIAFNRAIDEKVAAAVDKSGFIECVIAPSFNSAALEILKKKKNVRILELKTPQSDNFDFKKVSGGLLLQDKDLKVYEPNSFKIVTKKKPAKKEIESLLFAFKVAKHVKSNSIILVKGTKTVGIGAGQMSRVDSAYIAIKKAGKLAKGATCASDAFFPKEDAIIQLAKGGIKAIIQPGGSIADEQIIKTADKKGVAMAFCGMRHFKH